jgi:PAS domain S-box-containing protein
MSITPSRTPRPESAAATSGSRDYIEPFRQLVESIRQVFWIATPDRHRFHYVSPAFESIWKKRLEDVLRDASEWTTEIHPEDWLGLCEQFHAPIQEPREFEYRVIQPDRTIRWICDRVVPVRDVHGNVFRQAGLVEDVTERKSLASQLAQAQKLESLGQLAAGIAHEVNTPIHYVGDNLQFLDEAFRDLLGLLEALEKLIAQKPGGPEEACARLQEMREEFDIDYLLEHVPSALRGAQEGVHRVCRIVRDMGRFCHPGSNERVLSDLNESVRTTISVCRNEWKYVAEVVTELDPELPPVPCVRSEFSHVVLNLIINAAHAIEDRLGRNTDPKGTITVTTRKEDDSAVIEVADNGAGIPDEIRERVFDPFFTTKEVGRGSGQGLAITRSVVLRHQGTITVASEEGVGTTFTVRIPLSLESDLMRAEEKDGRDQEA